MFTEIFEPNYRTPLFWTRLITNITRPIFSPSFYSLPLACEKERGSHQTMEGCMGGLQSLKCLSRRLDANVIIKYCLHMCFEEPRTVSRDGTTEFRCNTVCVDFAWFRSFSPCRAQMNRPWAMLHCFSRGKGWLPETTCRVEKFDYSWLTFLRMSHTD